MKNYYHGGIANRRCLSSFIVIPNLANHSKVLLGIKRTQFLVESMRLKVLFSLVHSWVTLWSLQGNEAAHIPSFMAKQLIFPSYSLQCIIDQKSLQRLRDFPRKLKLHLMSVFKELSQGFGQALERMHGQNLECSGLTFYDIKKAHASGQFWL